jgi:hypothetical protein
MSPKTIAIVIIALWVAGPAAADEVTPPDTANGRFIFEQQASGFVRLDTQTGAVSLCSQRAVGWACAAAPEDRAVFENEIARLQADNAALKKALVSRGLPLPSGAGPEPGSEPPTAQNGQPHNDESNLRLPGDAEIERMVAFVDRVWRRLVDAINRAQKQMLNKS